MARAGWRLALDFVWARNGASGALLKALLRSSKGALKKNCTNSRATKKERGLGGRKRQCPALCEVCLRPSAIFADVTHAVGAADLAPATEHAEASLFAPFGQLNLFL